MQNDSVNMFLSEMLLHLHHRLLHWHLDNKNYRTFKPFNNITWHIKQMKPVYIWNTAVLFPAGCMLMSVCLSVCPSPCRTASVWVLVSPVFRSIAPSFSITTTALDGAKSSNCPFPSTDSEDPTCASSSDTAPVSNCLVLVLVLVLVGLESNNLITEAAH